jgi:hypothetical protein
MSYSHQFQNNQLEQMNNIQDLKPSMSIVTFNKTDYGDLRITTTLIPW